MAAPFQNNPTAQDIKAVSLKGGFAPTPGIAEGLATAANVIVPAVTQAHIKGINEDVSGQVESVKQALQATRNPALAESMFTEEALANPVAAEAFKQFNLIQDAARQGKLPQQFALERLEVIQNTAISNAPEFEQEIRAAMQQSSGIDPAKTLMAQYLSQTKQQESPAQKVARERQEQALRNGWGIEEQEEFDHYKAEESLATLKYDRYKRDGEYNIVHVGQEVATRGIQMYTDIGGMVRSAASTNGGALNADQQQHFNGMIDQVYQASVASIVAGSKNIPQSQIAPELAILEKHRDNLKGMIADGSLLKLVNNRNLLKKGQIEQAVLNSPEFGAAWALGGSQGFVEIMKWTEKASTKQSQDLMRGISPDADAAFSIQDVTSKVIKQFGQLDQPVPNSTADKNARVVAAGVALGTKGAEEHVYVSALESLRQIDPDGQLAFTSFNTKAVLQATAKSPTLQAAYINLYENNVSALSINYTQLAQIRGFSPERIKVSGGELVWDRVLGSIKDNDIDASINAEGEAFVARFNRTNKSGQTYNGAGLLPSTRYSGVQNLFGVVSSAVADLNAPEEIPADGVIKFVKDENGNLVRAQ